MQEVMSFCLWFLEQLPTFLLTPPISAFLGLIFLAWTIQLFRLLVNLK